MENTDQVLSIGFINIRGQTGLSRAKQVQIESFLTKQCLDVLHLQEINICDDSFSSCDSICSSFNIISNNYPSWHTKSFLSPDML